MNLSLTLFGKFALARDGQPIDLRSKKAQALLIYLALTGKSQSREHLATLLWGDRFDDQARRSLRQALFALRKAIGPDVIEGDDDIGLNKTLLRYDQDSDQPRTSSLLPDFRTGEEAFDEWLEGERQGQRSKAAQSLAEQASHATAANKPGEAATLWQQALAFDPHNEVHLRSLMAAMAADGRRGDALATYGRFAEKLNVDLDTTPSTETVSLARDLRSGHDPSPLSQQFSTTPTALGVKAHTLITPFEDLGGGDLAGFFAVELPSEINMRNRAINLVSIVTAEHFQNSEDQKTDILAEARARGAQSIISGSARQIGDKVRISASILSVKDNSVMWNSTAIFAENDAFQALGGFATDVTRQLARFVSGIGRFDDYVAGLESLVDDSDAFHMAMQNLIWHAFFVHMNHGHCVEIVNYSKRFLKYFPTSANLLTWLAFGVFHEGQLRDNGTGRLNNYHECKKHFDRAHAIDPTQNLTLSGRMIVNSWLGDFEAVDADYETLVALATPMHAADGLYAQSLIFRGRFDEALPLIKKTIELERGTPLLFFRYSFLGLGQFLQRDYAGALVSAENALSIGREFFLSHLLHIAALQRLGRQVDATKALEEFRAGYENPCVSEFTFLPIVDQSAKIDLLDALRDAGLPE